MNKKILMLTLMLLAMLTLAMVPVQAAKKEPLDFELYIEGVTMGYGEEGTYHAGPRGTELDDLTKPDLIQRTFHAKASNFVVFYAELSIEGEETYYFDARPEWSLIGDWVLEFDLDPPGGTLYIHDMSITDEDDVSFSGTGAYPTGGPYTITWGVTGTKGSNGVSITALIEYDGSSYYVNAIGTIAEDGTMSGTWSNPSQSGTWQSTSGNAVYVEDDFAISEEHSFNFNWNTLTGTTKAKDTVIFYELDGVTVWGTLEVSARDKIHYILDNDDNLEDLASEGNIFGHGTGALKGAKIEGATSGHIKEWKELFPDVWVPVIALTREGTITGWTSP